MNLKYSGANRQEQQERHRRSCCGVRTNPAGKYKSVPLLLRSRQGTFIRHPLAPESIEDKKMNHNKRNIASSIQQSLVRVYLVLMLGGFPFYFQHGYFNLVSAKKNYFQITSMVFLTLMICSSCFSYCCKEKRIRKIPLLSITDLCALFFGITIMISCFLSPVGAESFWGTQGRQMGGLFFLFCIGIYFVISRYYQPKIWILWLFFFSTILLWLVILCNFWNWDLFGMHRHLAKKTDFIGTLGNVNINACYSSVVSSLMFGFYSLSTKPWANRCFWCASFFGVYACYCTSSDSWVFAVGVSLLVLLFWSMGTPSKMMKWWMCWLAFLCSSLAINLTVFLADATNWKNIYIRNFQKQELLMFLTDTRLLLVEAVCCAILFWLIHSPCIHFFKKYGNKALAGLLVLGIFFAAVLIFPLDDDFGTNRGYIWKRTISNFQEFPIRQKLFGYGPNCFLRAMEERFGAEMHRRFSAPFLDAHNEILQILTITGLFGLLSYMGMQISLLASCLKNKQQNPFLFIGAVGITAYLAQGLVNNPYIFTSPLYFIFLGILESKIRNCPTCQLF